MKIGILTFHRSINYGAALQAFATKSLLQRHGHEVEIIDYFPLPGVLKEIKANIFSKNPINGIIRILIFRKFCRYMLDCSIPSVNQKKIIKSFKKYDLLLVGSDTVCEIKGKRTFSGPFPSLYLKAASFHPRSILWAASMDSSDEFLVASNLVELESYLEQFRMISIREPISAQPLNHNERAVVLRDPVFTLSNDDIIALTPKTLQLKRLTFENGFILYTGNSESIARYLSEYASKRDLILVAINKSAHAHVSLKKLLTPEEWFILHARARLVCTDRFHGAVVSFLFDKCPILLDLGSNKGSENKRTELMNLFGMPDLVLSKEKDLEKVIRKWESIGSSKTTLDRIKSVKNQINIDYQVFIGAL